MLAGAALLLAACGSGGTSASGDNAGSGGGEILATRDHGDIGPILVDSAGRTVYFSDQETGGKISCVDDCLGFWFPVVAKDGTAPEVSGVADLTVVHRSDNGQDQLAYQGKPLYTFKLDSSAGDVAGDNVEDSFGGKQFRWHVAAVGGAPTSNPDAGVPGGY